jgi:hypothetical protein
VSTAILSDNFHWLEEVGCIQAVSEGTCSGNDSYYDVTSPPWIYSTSYWVGWSYGYNCSVYYLDFDGDLIEDNFHSSVGVRPRITISTSELG